MTETSPGALFLTADRAADKAGTAGVPSFFTDVRVVRPDGTDVAPGEKGEVVVSGPNVMLGYWGLPGSDQRGDDATGGSTPATSPWSTTTASRRSSTGSRT